MKYNTINEYMGGGYMRPQMYQEGGLSRAVKNILGRSFITRGVQGAERALREEGREARKEAQRRGLLGMVGGFLGKYVAPSLLAASGLGGVGLLGSAIAKGLGAGAGRYLGEALGGATVKDSDVKSPTGFLSSSFEDIKDYREGLGEGAFGRALGTGAGAFITSGGGDYLKAVGKSKLGLPTSDKSVMIREDGELVKKMIPSVDTEAILGKAKTPELMQAFKEADTNRRDLMQEYYQRKAPTEKAFQESLGRAGELEDMNLREYARQLNLPSGEEIDFAGDLEVPEFDTSLPDFSGVPDNTEIEYLASLRRAKEIEDMNRSMLDMQEKSSGVFDPREVVDPNSPNWLLNYRSPSVEVGDLTVLGGSPRYGMNKGGLINPMSYARRIL